MLGALRCPSAQKRVRNGLLLTSSAMGMVLEPLKKLLQQEAAAVAVLAAVVIARRAPARHAESAAAPSTALTWSREHTAVELERSVGSSCGASQCGLASCHCGGCKPFC
jgi:hypothetical protein